MYFYSHLSTQLSFISSIRKDLIKLAPHNSISFAAKIERYYTNFFSWRNLYY